MALNLYETIELNRDSDWLTIWLNQPTSRNALSSTMVRELTAVISELQSDRGVRGVTLRGRGNTFCAGGDLRSFEALMGRNARAEEVAQANRDGGRLFEGLNSLPQVLVVLVEGAAMAGGFGMACCADLLAVRNDAQFALTEVLLGIPPAQIAAYVVNRLGLRTARRLMLTASRFDGAQAGALGLADFVADSVVLLEEFEAGIRRQVLRCAPGAIAATKDLLLKTQNTCLPDMQAYAAERFASCMLSPEGREGISAFLAKRKPYWALQQDPKK